MSNKIVFDPSRHGSIGKNDDGCIYVSFERELPHSRDKVWRAITDSEELKVWFPGISIELQHGGKFSINFNGECDGPAHVSGTVTTFDPPTTLQLGSMRYQLSPNEPDCLLFFSDILIVDDNRTPQQLAISVLGGWHAYLDKLEAALEAKPVREDFPEPDYSNIDVPGWDYL